MRNHKIKNIYKASLIAILFSLSFYGTCKEGDEHAHDKLHIHDHHREMPDAPEKKQDNSREHQEARQILKELENM